MNTHHLALDGHPLPGRRPFMAGWQPAMVAALMAVLAGLVLLAARSDRTAPMPASASHATTVAPPLAFEANGGRFEKQIRYVAHGRGHSVGLTSHGATVALAGSEARRLQLDLVGGARTAAPVGTERLAGTVNSYVGDDRGKWRTGIPTFGRVRYANVYPGIDVEWHGTQRALEYDFVVSPGADPARIAIAFGKEEPRLARNGDLLLGRGPETLAQKRPVAYQRINGARVPVRASWTIHDGQASFRLSAWDRSLPLVIDPVLDYSSYLGGSGTDAVTGVAFGSDGSMYVTGTTASSNFPKASAADSTLSGTELFVTKLNAAGTGIVYSTYLGGSGNDSAAGIAVDGAGAAYVTGSTFTTDYPSLHQLEACEGLANNFLAVADVVVSKLTSAGALVYSTCRGTDGHDAGGAIAIDAAGNAYITGTTWGGSATNWATTAGVVQPTAPNAFNAFALKLAFSANTLSTVYSTFLGGSTGDNSAQEDGYGIAVDSSGNAYVVGRTGSTDFPGTKTIDATHGGGYDGFALKLNASASAITWSTFVGASGDQSVDGVAVDASGRAHIAITDNAVASAQRINATGTAVDWSRAYSTNAQTSADGIALDSAGNSYMTGTTGASNFPVTNAFQAQRSGSTDAFVTKQTSTGAVVYATLFGGSGAESGKAIAVRSGQALVGGLTASTDLQTSGPYSGTSAGGQDGFLARIATASPTITSGPSGPTTSASPSFAFATESGSTARCAIDAQPTVVCSSPFNASGLSEGAHTLNTKATDSGGTDSAVASRAFVVDTVAPSAPTLRSPAEAELVPSFAPTFQWDAATDATSGITNYELEIDGSKVADLAPASCSAGVCELSAPSELSKGGHTFAVRAIDAAGHATSSGARPFSVGSPPTASFTIAPNPVLVGRSAVVDGSSSNTARGTISRWEWDLDGNGTFETDGGAAATASRTYPTAGSFNVSLRVTDNDGRTGTATQVLRVSATTGAGTQFGISIDKGAQYTNSPNVTLKAVFPGFTSSILVSNDGGFDNPAQFLPIGEIKWKLDSSGPERLPKTVYARFLPSVTQGLTFTDDIILDETPPKVDAATLVAPPATASASALRKWKIKVKARDSNSGVKSVQVTANKRKPGKAIAYKRSLTVKLGSRPKFLRARDRAGNHSRWKKLR